MGIQNELTSIRNAIRDQTCVGTEVQSDLTAAVDSITNLFGQYQTEFIQTAKNGNPIIQSQLDDWMSTVTDATTGVFHSLNAIHNAVYNGTASVLQECITSINDDYYSGSGPLQHPLEDRPYYEQILNTLNYYFGAQIEGAALLSEVRHLQACYEAADSDPDLNCDFQTVSTSDSAPPDEAYNICNDAETGTIVATFCQEAQQTARRPSRS